jgi:hypothetical protein
MATRDRFPVGVVIDTEFNGADRSEQHHVVAVVAQVYVDGRLRRTHRFFEDELLQIRRNPLPLSNDTLYVTFVGQAEWKSLISLGWELPRHSVDLYAESRCMRNLALPRSVRHRLGIQGDGLIDVCRWAGLDASDPLDKEAMRERILAGGPWEPGVPQKILTYCERDVQMTADLWFRLEPNIPLDRALFHGWFTQAIADMEHRGLPLDTPTRGLLIDNLADLRRRLILRFDRFGLCDPDSQAIDPGRLVTLVGGYDIRWPTTRTGRPVMRIEVLRKRLAGHPDLRPIVSLARGLLDLRGLRDLPVGMDGRARASLWPFSALTGRNLPKGREFIFQLSRWTRGLIRPAPGRFLCYSDWVAQEFAVIAYLSGDPLLIQCYEADGDPYANLGILMNLMPPGSKKGHPLRDTIKVIILGLFYGRGVRSIVAETRKPTRFIQLVVNDFWARCPRARRWLENYVDRLFLLGTVRTKCGWTALHHRLTKGTTAANFPVQAHGAEMMRWATCLGYENDVPWLCPVHDAFLSEGRVEDEEQIVATQEVCMKRGSSIITGGPIVRAKSVVWRYPERFADAKGWRAWAWITGALDPALAIRPARTA